MAKPPISYHDTVEVTDPDDDPLHGPSSGSKAAEFYANLGKTMALWARVERSIFDLFVFAMMSHPQKCSILFYRYQSINDKLEITNSILKISLVEEWYSKWSPVFNDLKANLNFRNSLAHNPIFKDLALSPYDDSQFIYYSATEQRKPAAKGRYYIALEDIKAHNGWLISIIDYLESFGIPATARKQPTAPPPQEEFLPPSPFKPTKAQGSGSASNPPRSEQSSLT